MHKLNYIILIAVIGTAVIFSGCIGDQEKTITETAQPTPIQQTPVQPIPVQTTQVQATAAMTPVTPYQVEAAEIRTLQDCIVSPISSEIKSCTFINLVIKNNNVKILDFKLVKEEIIARDSRVLPARYEKEVGLNDLCTRQSGMEFILDEGTERNIGLCHPTINNADEPVLNIEALINGERKKYVFGMTS
jgi:hypothetical protein